MGFNIMKTKTVISLAAATVLATAAFAGEEVHTKMKMIVVDGHDDGETRIELDSDELGFDLHDMQVGENQAIVDSAGRNILVTREQDGFSIDVEGKTIKLPAFDGSHDRVWVEKIGADEDVDVHVIHDETHEQDGQNIKIIKKKIEIKSESSAE